MVAMYYKAIPGEMKSEGDVEKKVPNIYQHEIKPLSGHVLPRAFLLLGRGEIVSGSLREIHSNHNQPPGWIQ